MVRSHDCPELATTICTSEKRGPAAMRRAARFRQTNEGSHNEAMGHSERRASASHDGRFDIYITQGD
jgi:hypothetical protein